MSVVSVLDNLIDGLKPTSWFKKSEEKKQAEAEAKLQDEVTEGLAGSDKEENEDTFTRTTSTTSTTRRGGGRRSAQKVDTEIAANKEETKEVKAEEKANEADSAKVDAEAKENETATSEVKSALDTNNANLNAAEAKVDSSNAQLDNAEAGLNQAKQQEAAANAALQGVMAGAAVAEDAEAQKAAEAKAKDAQANAAQATANAEAAVETAQENVAKAEAEKEDLEDEKEDLEDKEAKLEDEKEKIDSDKEDLVSESKELESEEETLVEEKEELEAEKAEIEAEEEAKAEEKAPEAEKLNCSNTAQTAQEPAEEEVIEIEDNDTPMAAAPAVVKPQEKEEPAVVENPIKDIAEEFTPVVEQPAEQPQQPAVDAPVADVEQKIADSCAMDTEMTEYVQKEFYNDEVAIAEDEVVDMNAMTAIESLQESVKVQMFSKSVYRNNISKRTDVKSVDENQKAVSDFMSAYNDAADKVNAPNVEFLSLTDKSNFETAQTLINRLNQGEYIITKEVEKATVNVQSVQVSADEKETKEERKYEIQGENILRQLQGKITEDDNAPEDKTDDILTKNEYADIENFFESADSKATAYSKLVKEAKQYGVYSSEIAA